jgi:lysophospholipase L1-like esterase
MTTSGKETYPLARGLSAGSHTVEIFKRIESTPTGRAIGTATFLGFRIPATGTASAPPTRAHSIEFVGDSVTCGYGNMASFDTTASCPTAYTTFMSNADDAYGALVARDLDAELMLVSYSGLGLGINSCIYPAGTPTLPERYDSTLPDDMSGAKWSFEWQPDAVVVNLGANDWAAMTPALSRSSTCRITRSTSYFVGSIVG